MFENLKIVNSMKIENWALKILLGLTDSRKFGINYFGGKRGLKFSLKRFTIRY